MPDDQEYATPCTCGSTNRPTRDALSDGEPEVRAIFAQSAVGIAYLGLDGRWLRANRCLCDMLEYTEQDLQQRTIQDITYPDDRGAQRASLHRVLTGENAAYAGEQRFLRPNGSLVGVRLIVSAVCNQSGTPCYFLFLAVTDDITARKQDEEERAALQVRERRAREISERADFRVQQVLDVLPEGIVVADTRGQVIMSNRAAQDIAGAGVTGRFMLEADAEGQETYGVCHPDGSPYLTRDLPLQRAIRRGEVVRGEQVLIRHHTTGRETPLVVNSAPLRDAAGITIGGVVTFQDGAMLTNLEQAREEVIDETAHDLMTLLTSVCGNAALARRRLAHTRTPDIAAVTSPLMAIESATRRMASLIDDLRPSMHAQACGSPLLERRPTDLVALMRVLIARQQGLAPHHIRLEAAAPVLMVECDAIGVERAAANLLANANAYSPEGGDIMVGVTSEHDATGNWAVLTVQDHGMGIPVEDLPHIFERLYRGRNATGRIHGTGIGLASVRRIVEQHGGMVTAESREGAGSTVTIRLPLQRTPLVH